MLDINEFDMGLKLTWIRKMEKENPDWLSFANSYKIDRLIKTDESYHEDLYKRTTNPFWKCVISAYIRWYSNAKNNIEIQPSEQHLWGNPLINIPFNNDLFINGIIYLKDLFDYQGNPRSKENLENLIGKQIMWTTYMALRLAIPNLWKIDLLHKTRDQNITIPSHITWILSDKKGTKNIRKIYRQLDETKPMGQIKWEIELEKINLNWKYLYSLTTNCKMNARSKYFQFQILHRSLVTNKKLHQFNIRDNELCDNCNSTETISHLLYDCTGIKRLWVELETWLNSIMTKPVVADKLSILLGNPENELIINYVYIICKHEIYKGKWNRSPVNIIKIKKILKSHMELDIHLGTVNKTLPKILGKWSSLYNVLK